MSDLIIDKIRSNYPIVSNLQIINQILRTKNHIEQIFPSLILISKKKLLPTFAAIFDQLSLVVKNGQKCWPIVKLILDNYLTDYFLNQQPTNPANRNNWNLGGQNNCY